MIGIQITESKDFMGKLLKSDCFHIFLLEEATITTASTYHIDGRINKEFFSTEELNDLSFCDFTFMPWEQISPFCFELIKGKRTPLNFKFVLHLIPEQLETLLSDGTLSSNTIGQTAAQAMCVNDAVLTIKYDGTMITLITGISYQTFVLDKTPDKLWDAYISKFLDQKGIKFTLL